MFNVVNQNLMDVGRFEICIFKLIKIYPFLDGNAERDALIASITGSYIRVTFGGFSERQHQTRRLHN